MKYTIKDLINKKIIISCTYMQAKSLAKELKSEEIDTTLVDKAIVVHDPIFYFTVNDGKLIGIACIEDGIKEDGYTIIDFDDLNISSENAEKESFELKEIVHVILDIKKREPFNIFAGTEHFTAYISAIDEKNRMCEVVNIKDNNESMWVTFDEIFHIEHTYEYYFEEEGDAYD